VAASAALPLVRLGHFFVAENVSGAFYTAFYTGEGRRSQCSSSIARFAGPFSKTGNKNGGMRVVLNEWKRA
jgi:hypothetical protein